MVDLLLNTIEELLEGLNSLTPSASVSCQLPYPPFFRISWCEKIQRKAAQGTSQMVPCGVTWQGGVFKDKRPQQLMSEHGIVF